MITVWLDYAKAFDSVLHSWLFTALRLGKGPENIIVSIWKMSKLAYDCYTRRDKSNDQNWYNYIFQRHTSTFSTLDKCGSIRTQWKNFKQQIFIAIWNFMCESMRCHVFIEYNNGRSKRAYKSKHIHAISVFCDVNSTLYTVTNIQPKARPGFYWRYQCFS